MKELATSALPLPSRSTDFRSWAGYLAACFPFVTAPIPPKEESDWRRWASAFIANSQLLLPVPTRSQFPKNEDWRHWAILVINCTQ